LALTGATEPSRFGRWGDLTGKEGIPGSAFIKHCPLWANSGHRVVFNYLVGPSERFSPDGSPNIDKCPREAKPEQGGRLAKLRAGTLTFALGT
jgi:hypothetical protein